MEARRLSASPATQVRAVQLPLPFMLVTAARSGRPPLVIRRDARACPWRSTQAASTLCLILRLAG